MQSFSSARDLRNYIDNATSGYDNRTDADVDAIVASIRADPESPRWGADWDEYLANLPEDLNELI